jgi:pyrroloquinoline quinone biosynthesis protein E
MTEPGPEPPLAMLLELTHRCPLRCPYCSNPLDLARARDELDAATWRRVLEEAAALGVLQVHLSGGEPLVRRDLEEVAADARRLDLYVNLITSGVGLDERRMAALAAAGVEHVQLSLQDVEPEAADAVAGRAGAHDEKLAAARAVTATGLPLTINWVVHRGNAAQVRSVIDLAVTLGAGRVEIAHAQLYGWGYRNREALVPTPEQVARVRAEVEEARERLRGTLRIDAVIPDTFARRPKACMAGWGRQLLVVTPAGTVLPCHAAETLPGLRFERVSERSLGWIWRESPAFARYRGTGWMPEPCRSCDRRSEDWGGCRCQTFAVTGDAGAVDPVCELSPDHPLMKDIARRGATAPRVYAFRGRSGGARER